jgi:hypothetical protein
MTKHENDMIYAEINALKEIIKKLHEMSVIDRLSLKTRMLELLDELEKI